MEKCKICESKNIIHEEKIGRGKAPKNWKRKLGDKKRYSWKGIWDIYTCEDCGHIKKILR